MLSALFWLLLSLSTFVTSSSALASKPTEPELASYPLLPRKYNPIPNPFHVPGTQIILEFDEEPEEWLNIEDVNILFRRIRQSITRRIQQKGDGNISLGLQSFQIKNIKFSFDSNPHWRTMRYSDLLAVIRGFEIKMRNEGFRERYAVVVYRQADGVDVDTGEVNIRLSDRLHSVTSA